MNIINGDFRNNFHGKNSISRGELKKIISLTSGENGEKILNEYKKLKNIEENEENLVLSSAGEEKLTMDFSEIYEKISYIEPFDGKNLYKNIDTPIFANIDENGEINFPKIDNLAEYSLYFDYK